jgi:CubicO group peptidase (beta-lactamase class C family)
VNADGAAAYAELHGLQALLIVRDGSTVFERYADGFGPHTPHALYSGTKSFWGVLAVAAKDDGLLDLDETVGSTFPAWNAGLRKGVTLRHLLQLTSGIGFGGLGNAVPTYERALAVELKNPPGSTFTYGGIPLQVFGAVLAAKLAPQQLTPHEYLHERLLSPIAMKIDRWRSLADGTQPLPTGAFVAAAEWAKYGRFVLEGGMWNGTALVSMASLVECFASSAANPKYGLGWWLDVSRPNDRIAYASGSGGQAMYLIGAQNCVVVKFGRSASYKHETFLRHLLG